VKRGYAKLSQQPELYQRAQPAVNNDISKGLKDQDRKTGLIWHPLYVNLQLCNLETEGNALFSFHTFIGFLGLQMSLEFVFVLLQVHNPRFFSDHTRRPHRCRIGQCRDISPRSSNPVVPYRVRLESHIKGLIKRKQAVAQISFRLV